MPQFIMTGAIHAAHNESEFVLGFITAMFWTESSCFSSDVWDNPETQESIAEGTSDGTIPNDVGYTDLHPDSLKTIRELCGEFVRANESLLNKAYDVGYSEERAGHDFWLTMNGHGAGFWDRDELEGSGNDDGDSIGDILTKSSKVIGSEMNLSWDGGFIYLE